MLFGLRVPYLGCRSRRTGARSAPPHLGGSV